MITCFPFSLKCLSPYFSFVHSQFWFSLEPLFNDRDYSSHSPSQCPCLFFCKSCSRYPTTPLDSALSDFSKPVVCSRFLASDLSREVTFFCFFASAACSDYKLEWFCWVPWFNIFYCCWAAGIWLSFSGLVSLFGANADLWTCWWSQLSGSSWSSVSIKVALILFWIIYFGFLDGCYNFYSFYNFDSLELN